MAEIYAPWFASQLLLTVAVGLSLRGEKQRGNLREFAPLLVGLPIPVIGAIYVAYLHWIAFADEPLFGRTDLVGLAIVLLVLWLMGGAVARLALAGVQVQGK